MLDDGFLAKLKGLIEEYSKNTETFEEKPEEKTEKEGKMIVIQGESGGEEMPEELEKLIDFIRRG